MKLHYRGITYTITPATTPDVWRWRVMVGNPKMLRLGEAKSEVEAEVAVKRIVDRSIKMHRGEPDPENL